MIGRFRPLGFWSLRTRRLAVVLLVVVLLVFSLLPRQAQLLLNNLGKPIADIVTIPLESMASINQNMQDWWNKHVAAQTFYEQNVELRRRVQTLEGKLNQFREQALTARRLTKLLKFQKKIDMETLAAKVIGRSTSNWHEGIILNKGDDDGVAIEMGVITPAGVVGKIVKTASSSSIALLVTDPNFAVTGLIQRTRDEGIIQGKDKGLLRMKYIPPLSNVEKGDAIITSGLTGGFPRGLLIGEILKIGSSEEGDLFQTVDVAPVPNLGKLEEVLIIMTASPEKTMTFK